jgi:hypothetical protein
LQAARDTVWNDRSGDSRHWPQPRGEIIGNGQRRVLAAPGFGAVANQRSSPDSLGFARPFAPSSPRPDPRLRRNESAVLLCRQHRDHILYQPPTIATGFHYQANLIARPQLFGSQMGGMFGQVMDKRTNAFFPERPNAWIPVPVLDELFA